MVGTHLIGQLGVAVGGTVLLLAAVAAAWFLINATALVLVRFVSLTGRKRQ